MISIKKTVVAVGCALILAGSLVCYAAPKAAQAQAAAPAAASRQLGTVKAISGNSITLTTDAGSDVAITVADGARLVRTAPGQKDLTGATVISLQDIQVGDRILARGKASEDGKSLSASAIIVMKKSDIAQKQTHERELWQRGAGGPVTAIDAAKGDITISSSSAGPAKSVVVHTTKSTIVRRYSPDSIKFDDAKLATLDQIKVGDQLRARGTRSADGSEVSADEIVAGTFHNIAATVISTDVPANTVTVMDLATKKPTVIKVTADSQLRNLPEMMAQMIAMRLKGGAAEANGAPPENGNGHNGAPPMQASARPGAGAPPWGGSGRMGGPGGPGGPNGAGAARGGDINQMLARLPAITVAELKKGDALMIVSTQGDDTGVTAITLLSGVEPILTASPKDGQMILSPWSLSAGGEGGGEGSAE